MDSIENMDLKVLEMKRDALVRALRTERDYRRRGQMNDILDKIIDEIETYYPDEERRETGDSRKPTV